MPDRIAPADWSVNSAGEVTIAALPPTNPPITLIEYRLESTAPNLDLGGVAPGTCRTTAAPGQVIQLRLTNAEGAGLWSSPKTVPA